MWALKKEPSQESLLLLLLSLLFLLFSGRLNAQEGSPSSTSLNESDSSWVSTVTILPPWEEGLRKLESLLDSWATDSEKQLSELKRFQDTVNSLNLSLRKSELDLLGAQKSEAFWKNLALYWEEEATRIETEKMGTEKKLSVYKWVAVGTGSAAAVGWLLFVFSVWF